MRAYNNNNSGPPEHDKLNSTINAYNSQWLVS